MMLHFKQNMGILVFIISASIGVSAHSQDDNAPKKTRTLTEAEVIKLALQAAPRLRAAQAEVKVARAQVVSATLMRNPSLQWEQEQGDATEDRLIVAIPVDVSGRRAAGGAMSRSEVAMAQAEMKLERAAVVERALQLYYSALATVEEVGIAKRAVARLDEAARVVSLRHAEGAVSGYDRLRLDIEVDLARSQLHQAQGEERRTRGVLGVLLALDGNQIQLEGALKPNSQVKPDLDTETWQTRPSEKQMKKALSQLDEAAQAAGRAWIPRLNLKGGMRTHSGSPSDYGYMAGVSMELPVFSHGQDLSSAAGASRGAVKERLAAREQAAQAHARGSSLRLEASRTELARLKKAMAPRLEHLDSGALASYREGASGITKLLDAQRTRTAVERRLLELTLNAKVAELALRTARGELQ